MELRGPFFSRGPAMKICYAISPCTLSLTICSTAKEGQTLAFIAICTDEHKWQAPQDLFYDTFSFVMETNPTIISVF
jgi:hypothetical protein